MTTVQSGAMSRILFIRRFTCMPMRLVTAWLMRYGRNTSWHRRNKTDDIFIQNYKDLLKSGGKDRYDVALKRFDLDAGKPAFWSLGLDMISGMIDELEGLA